MSLNSLFQTAVIISLVGCCSIEPAVEVPVREPLPETAAGYVIHTEQMPESDALYSDGEESEIAYAKPLLSQKDTDTLARLVYLEAGICSYRCKELVASCVVNRMKSGYWGKTLDDVIYSRGQFDSACRLYSITPYRCPEAPYYEKTKEFIGNWDECYRAARVAAAEGSRVPGYVMYFSSGSPFNWQGYRVYEAADGMYFGYLQKDVR